MKYTEPEFRAVPTKTGNYIVQKKVPFLFFFNRWKTETKCHFGIAARDNGLITHQVAIEFDSLARAKEYVDNERKALYDDFKYREKIRALTTELL